jgi:hypothetical protein
VTWFFNLAEATVKFSDNQGVLKKFRSAVWKFQQTFQTPLKDLNRFTSTIITATGPLKTATVTVDLVVFDPEHLLDLLTRHSIPHNCERGVSFTAEGSVEIEALLRAVLSDSIDFIFVPDPKSSAIFADHDEFTTFYAQTRSNLNRVVHPLVEAGFKQIQDYRREASPVPPQCSEGVASCLPSLLLRSWAIPFSYLITDIYSPV